MMLANIQNDIPENLALAAHMTTKQQTVKEFTASTVIRMKLSRAKSNPNMEGSAEMDNWFCEFFSKDSRWGVYFSKDKGHNGKEPSIDEVLDRLASDALDRDLGFEDWCGSLGYDTDSRKAERIYKTIQRQTSSLEALIGVEALHELLYQTERL